MKTLAWFTSVPAAARMMRVPERTLRSRIWRQEQPALVIGEMVRIPLWHVRGQACPIVEDDIPARVGTRWVEAALGVSRMSLRVAIRRGTIPMTVDTSGRLQMRRAAFLLWLDAHLIGGASRTRSA